MIDPALQTKLDHLSGLLRSYSRVALAFSGGVDSTFLLKFAHNTLGDDVMAVTATAPNFSPDETERAVNFCKEEGIRHLLIDPGKSYLESFSHNPNERCYICKKYILESMLARAELAGMVLVDGTNTDDAFDFRPGERALLELGVSSPLRESELSKADIRSAAKELNLAIWDKPAFACLASRIPYGEKITVEKLRAVYAIEKLLLDSGFSQVRVRHHGEIARIEVLPTEREKFFDAAFMDKINEAAKRAGFIYSALDLAGYKMGGLNRL